MTTSSTWSFRVGLPLRGVGIDLELVARFARLGSPGGDDWPLVFTAEEVRHARRSAAPAAALCAAFCAKEALFKALGAPVEYTEAELLLTGRDEAQRLELSQGLRRAHGIADSRLLVRWPSEQECLAVVYLFGQAPLP